MTIQPRTGVIAGWLAALAIGFGVGRWSVPDADPTPGLVASRPAATGPVGLAPPPVSPQTDAVATLDRPARSSADLLDDPDVRRVALEWAARAATGSEPPEEVIASAIDSLDDRSLVSVITALTDFESAELEQVADLRGFASRLAAIAAEGTVAPAPEPDPQLETIEFSTEVYDDHTARGVANHFDRDTERIYAVFDSEATSSREVLVKWMRADDGVVMLLRRYPIDVSTDHNFVWLGRPPDGWKPGEYRVDVFTADDALSPIASGSHVVVR